MTNIKPAPAATVFEQERQQKQASKTFPEKKKVKHVKQTEVESTRKQKQDATGK